MCLMLAH